MACAINLATVGVLQLQSNLYVLSICKPNNGYQTDPKQGGMGMGWLTWFGWQWCRASSHCLNLVGASSLAYMALPCLSCHAAMVVGHQWLGGAIGDGDGWCWAGFVDDGGGWGREWWVSAVNSHWQNLPTSILGKRSDGWHVGNKIHTCNKAFVV